MTLVELSDVSYTYPGAPEPALDGVCLTVTAGQVLVVAGLSGSGKSTLLRVINGLAPHFYGGSFAGEARVSGLDTREHGPAELAAHVGTLFQDPETEVILGTPRAELAFPLENRGFRGASIARAVEETALALGIEALLDRRCETLSGGELQRVALGATLVGRPALVCLDEPTSQLDPVAGDELISLLRRLNEDTDLTVVLAEHRLERCLMAADRVVALGNGRVAFDGTPPDFLDWALDAAPKLVTAGARMLAAVGLAPVPGVRAARASLRSAGYRLDHDPAVFEQRVGSVGTVGSAGSAGSVGSVGPAGPAGVERAKSDHGAGALRWRRPPGPAGALRFVNVWHELKDGPVVLRNVSLELAPGERVALMGRNGAGKSTLLRHASGLMAPTRGRVEAAGRVALLLQNPGDYLVHDTVDAELGGKVASYAHFGLARLAARHPRDLSGGERQRLALAIVLGEPGSGDAPAAICLDEPTRGMDRAARDELSELLEGYGGAVVMATHDPEFAAAFADRVVLLAEGAVIADGTPAAVLAGGVYFSTEVGRILAGLHAEPVEAVEPAAPTAAALLPAEGVVALRRGGLAATELGV
jgi:energy-coupling factor transport system ATP-binding protein